MTEFKPLTAEELVIAFEGLIKEFGLENAIKTIEPQLEYLQTQIKLENDDELARRFKAIKEQVVGKN